MLLASTTPRMGSETPQGPGEAYAGGGGGGGISGGGVAVVVVVVDDDDGDSSAIVVVVDGPLASIADAPNAALLAENKKNGSTV